VSFAPGYSLLAVMLGADRGTATLGTSIKLSSNVIGVATFISQFAQESVTTYGGEVGVNVAFWPTFLTITSLVRVFEPGEFSPSRFRRHNGSLNEMTTWLNLPVRLICFLNEGFGMALQMLDRGSRLQALPVSRRQFGDSNLIACGVFVQVY
jgi:hypothetical protein